MSSVHCHFRDVSLQIGRVHCHFRGVSLPIGWVHWHFRDVSLQTGWVHCQFRYVCLLTIFELPHDKTNKWPVHPVKTLIRRNTGPLTTYWAHGEDSDQTGEMPRLIWDFAWRMSFCWFCRAAVHFLQKFMYAMQFCSADPDQMVSHVLWCLIWIYSIYQEPCQGINEFILSYITCPISYHPCQLPTQ